ncbi:MAG: hypothetical protein ACRDD7_08790 [Peptostreptococcaceae bacterium]
MIELKRGNIHKIVATELDAQNLVYAGYERLTPKVENTKDDARSIEDFNLTVERIDAMGVLEMKEIAKAVKIKGYSNMGRSSLSKTLKEMI